MNTPLPNAHTFEASRGIVDLLQVNADQARLGNLLKLAMDEPLSADLLRKFDQLTADIRATQDDLKKIAREIDASIGRKK
ncbi:MAG: hypothetical protein Q8O73_17565 [Thalassospira sp.]|nr:hypothetical protein [Thalassospira sp.]MDP2699923.1 hypothetical protein [Thalassospira sp.]